MDSVGAGTAVPADGRLQQFVVGFVRSPHGISGEFKVESASGECGHFARMTDVTLRNGGGGEARPFKVERVDFGGHDLYMKLAGVDSPEAARKFANWEIVVPRGNARPLGEDEWYVEDLKGCSLVYGGECGLEGGPVVVGTVTGVMEGGAGDLLEVALAEECEVLADFVKYSQAKDGSKRVRTVYVPLMREAGFIGDVDVDGRKIELMHLWILE